MKTVRDRPGVVSRSLFMLPNANAAKEDDLVPKALTVATSSHENTLEELKLKLIRSFSS